MSGIAEILIRLDYKVSGSDIQENTQISLLKKLGANITIGHSKLNIPTHTNVVIYSSAIPQNNPEVTRAKELKIPLIKRAEMLTELMRMKYGIAVSGSHGKTTTSSMLATIMYKNGIDITHIIGGIVSNFGSNARLGKK